MLIVCFVTIYNFFPRLKLALAIPTGTPITVANHGIEMLSVVTNRAINDFVKPFAH